VPRQRLVWAAHNPARLVLIAFSTLIVVGTVLLRLPASVDGDHPGLLDALFMSTSSATVTGLATFDISVLSLTGELVVLALIQVGGFGIMALGSILAIIASHRMGLYQRRFTSAEFGSIDNEDLKSIMKRVAQITLSVEGAIAVVLFARFTITYGEAPGRAAYSAVFHAVSAFNNAGISLNSDSLIPYATDWTVLLAMSAGFIIGGLGFPVLIDIARKVKGKPEGLGYRRGHLNASRWLLHTKLVVATTAVLLVLGPVVIAIAEWGNPDTLGPMAAGEKILTAWFEGGTARTAGFSTIDIGALSEPTQVFMSTLMFIGAGPASTSGGIKVTTFAVLGFVIWAEARGQRDVNAFGRRLPRGLIRQAITVALLSVGLVIGTALVLMSAAEITLTPALFEAASAFGTVGLSTGITGDLPPACQVLLVLVMLAGRIGPVTFVTALALRNVDLPYRFPEERPIIG
jgi:trk system potassium uptake protein TrkH